MPIRYNKHYILRDENASFPGAFIYLWCTHTHLEKDFFFIMWSKQINPKMHYLNKEYKFDMKNDKLLIFKSHNIHSFTQALMQVNRLMKTIHNIIHISATEDSCLQQMPKPEMNCRCPNQKWMAYLLILLIVILVNWCYEKCSLNVNNRDKVNISWMSIKHHWWAPILPFMILPNIQMMRMRR